MREKARAREGVRAVIEVTKAAEKGKGGAKISSDAAYEDHVYMRTMLCPTWLPALQIAELSMLL